MGPARRLGFQNASKDAFEAIAPVREGMAFVIGANGAKLLKETAHGSLQEIRPLMRQAVAQTPSNLAQHCSIIMVLKTIVSMLQKLVTSIVLTSWSLH